MFAMNGVVYSPPYDAERLCRSGLLA